MFVNSLRLCKTSQPEPVSSLFDSQISCNCLRDPRCPTCRQRLQLAPQDLGAKRVYVYSCHYCDHVAELPSSPATYASETSIHWVSDTGPSRLRRLKGRLRGTIKKCRKTLGLTIKTAARKEMEWSKDHDINLTFFEDSELAEADSRPPVSFQDNELQFLHGRFEVEGSEIYELSGADCAQRASEMSTSFNVPDTEFCKSPMTANDVDGLQILSEAYINQTDANKHIPKANKESAAYPRFNTQRAIQLPTQFFRVSNEKMRSMEQSSVSNSRIYPSAEKYDNVRGPQEFRSIPESVRTLINMDKSLTSAPIYQYSEYSGGSYKSSALAQNPKSTTPWSKPPQEASYQSMSSTPDSSSLPTGTNPVDYAVSPSSSGYRRDCSTTEVSSIDYQHPMSTTTLSMSVPSLYGYDEYAIPSLGDQADQFDDQAFQQLWIPTVDTHASLHPSISERLDSKNDASHVPGSTSRDNDSAQESSVQTLLHPGYANIGTMVVRQYENLSKNFDLVETGPNVTASQPYVIDRGAMSALSSSQHADTLMQEDDIRMLHKCPHCNSTFNCKDKGNLNRHIKSLHASDRFPCLWRGCDLKPNRLDNLSRHFDRVHVNKFPNEPCAWESNGRICVYPHPNSESLKKHVQETYLAQHLSSKG